MTHGRILLTWRRGGERERERGNRLYYRQKNVFRCCRSIAVFCTRWEIVCKNTVFTAATFQRYLRKTLHPVLSVLDI